MPRGRPKSKPEPDETEEQEQEETPMTSLPGTVTFDDETGEVIRDDDDDDDGPPSPAMFLDPNYKPKRDKPATETPITNKAVIPLFPDAGKNPKSHAVAIGVTKVTPPGDGYKGRVEQPERVDKAYLGQCWGDGVYDLELLDQNGNVLRKSAGVKIAMGLGAGTGQPATATAGPSGVDIEAILKRVTESFERTIDVVRSTTIEQQKAERARLAEERADERVRAKQHIDLMREQTKAEAESVRAFYGAQQAAAAETSKTLLTILTTSHQHSMEQMAAARERENNNNSPLMFLRIFQEGMSQGGGRDEGDGAERIIKSVTSGLADLKGLADAGRAPPKKLAASAGNGTTALAKKPNPSVPTTGAAPASKKEMPLSKAQLREVLELKIAMDKKGVPFDELLGQAKAFYNSDAPVTEEVDEEDEFEDDEPEADEDAKPDEAAAKPADDVGGAQPT